MSMLSRLAVERPARGLSAAHDTRNPGQLARPIVAFLSYGATLLSDVACLSAVIAVFSAAVAGSPLATGLDSSASGYDQSAASAALGVVVLGYLAVSSHYSRRIPFWTELQGLVSASLWGAVLCICIAIADRRGSLVVVFAASLICFVPFALLARKAVRRGLTRANLWQVKTILVAGPSACKQALSALRSEPGLGYDIIALLDPAKFNENGPHSGWRSLMQQYGAGLLVLAYDASAAPGRRMTEALVRDRIPFAVMPQLEGLPAIGFEQTRFFSHDTVLVSYRNNLGRPMLRFFKIMFDLLLAVGGLIVLAPLLLIVAALVKMDGGPVLFGHTRVGAKGARFKVLKFRSMVVNSDAVLQQLIASDPAAEREWRLTQKLRRDPRVTRIGRFLRMTSLDELPQLFNVLRLEMSIVGPRPIVQAEIARYGEDIAYYYEARPGLTGLWQVSGRTDTTYAQRVQLDTWYVKNWTIWHDLAIIAKTFPAVLNRRGAC